MFVATAGPAALSPTYKSMAEPKNPARSVNDQSKKLNLLAEALISVLIARNKSRLDLEATFISGLKFYFSIISTDVTLTGVTGLEFSPLALTVTGASAIWSTTSSPLVTCPKMT